MQNKRKKVLAGILMLILLASAIFAVYAQAGFGSGVAVIAEGSEIIKTGLAGKKIIFNDLDIKQGLCISDFESIEITEIPKSTEGTLMLAGRRVGVGTVIKRKNIGALVFIPASTEVKECKFSFTTDSFANGATVDFVLKFIEAVNYAPKTEGADSDVCTLTTQREIGVYGSMYAKDKEGDALEYMVIKYPEAGSLKIINKETGEFLYTPPDDYIGTAEFTYVARDEYGNFSYPAKVEIEVEERMSEVVYEDMKKHKDYNAAVALTAMGVMDGRLIGDGVYFMPESTVTKAEFVCMAMKCAGIAQDTTLTSSYFDDNEKIPAALVGYVATAGKLGIIGGKFTGECLNFSPNDNITLYEAAMIMSELTDGASNGEISVFSEDTPIPVWTKSAIYEMCALEIFDKEEQDFSVDTPLTKAECAAYLYKLSELTK